VAFEVEDIANHEADNTADVARWAFNTLLAAACYDWTLFWALDIG